MKQNKIIYIIVATIVSTVSLYFFTKTIPELIPEGNLIKETLMCSGQIIWQGLLFTFFISKKGCITYIQHMITVSLIGSLLLIPLIISSHVFSIQIETKLILFLSIVGFMVFEHAKRVQKLRLPTYLTITWVGYRIIWIPILLF